MLEIRKAASNDMIQIHQLDRESVNYHKRFDKSFFEISEKWWKIKRTSQIKAMKKSSDLILVAEENDKIIGYAWGYIDKIAKCNVGKIQDIVVTSRYRKKGVSTCLIKEMMKFFISKKCAISEVEVHARNNAAKCFYEKSGFVRQSCRMRLRFDKFSPFS